MARIAFAGTGIPRTVETTHEPTHTVLKATIDGRAREPREFGEQWRQGGTRRTRKAAVRTHFPTGDRQALLAPDTECLAGVRHGRRIGWKSISEDAFFLGVSSRPDSVKLAARIEGAQSWSVPKCPPADFSPVSFWPDVV
jgi:hypothetical protein